MDHRRRRAGIHAIQEGLRGTFLARRAGKGVLRRADHVSDEARGFRSQRGSKSPEPRQVGLREDQLGRGSRPGGRRDEAHPLRLRTGSDNVPRLLAPQLGQPRLPLLVLGPVLQHDRVHRYPRQPGQLGGLALGCHPRLRLLLASGEPGALRPAGGRTPEHRTPHLLEQRSRHHARHLRRYRLRRVARLAAGQGHQDHLHRSLPQLHRGARGREVDRLPARHHLRAGPGHRLRVAQ